MVLELLVSGRMLANGHGFDPQYCKTRLYKATRGNKGSHRAGACWEPRWSWAVPYLLLTVSTQQALPLGTSGTGVSTQLSCLAHVHVCEHAYEGRGSGSSPIEGHTVLSIVLCYGQTATKCLGVTGVTFKSDEAPLCAKSDSFPQPLSFSCFCLM